MKKIAFFNQKRGLTPLKKYHFWDFEKFRFYTQKTVSFLSRTLLNLISSLVLTKAKKRELVFFDQKHGLTPLGKCDF